MTCPYQCCHHDGDFVRKNDFVAKPTVQEKEVSLRLKDSQQIPLETKINPVQLVETNYKLRSGSSDSIAKDKKFVFSTVLSQTDKRAFTKSDLEMIISKLALPENRALISKIIEVMDERHRRKKSTVASVTVKQRRVDSVKPKKMAAPEHGNSKLASQKKQQLPLDEKRPAACRNFALETEGMNLFSQESPKFQIKEGKQREVKLQENKKPATTEKKQVKLQENKKPAATDTTHEVRLQENKKPAATDTTHEVKLQENKKPAATDTTHEVRLQENKKPAATDATHEVRLQENKKPAATDTTHEVKLQENKKPAITDTISTVDKITVKSGKVYHVIKKFNKFIELAKKGGYKKKCCKWNHVRCLYERKRIELDMAVPSYFKPTKTKEKWALCCGTSFPCVQDLHIFHFYLDKSFKSALATLQTMSVSQFLNPHSLYQTVNHFYCGTKLDVEQETSCEACEKRRKKAKNSSNRGTLQSYKSVAAVDLKSQKRTPAVIQNTAEGTRWKREHERYREESPLFLISKYQWCIYYTIFSLKTRKAMPTTQTRFL